jgi:signal transduction histidine kinase
VEYELRRTTERALHDGVQQHLVALGVKLQLAQQAAEADATALPPILEELVQDVHDALDEVRRLAWRMYPSLLLDRGLVEALREAVSGRIDAHGVGRYARDVEAAVYFACVDILEEGEADATVRLEDDGRDLRLEVSSGAEPERVSRAAERIEAAGGRLTFAQGTISATIPLGRPPRPGT